jgi:hypothetical protein
VLRHPIAEIVQHPALIVREVNAVEKLAEMPVGRVEDAHGDAAVERMGAGKWNRDPGGHTA